jgi:hypothetical protein
MYVHRTCAVAANLHCHHFADTPQIVLFYEMRCPYMVRETAQIDREEGGSESESARSTGLIQMEPSMTRSSSTFLLTPRVIVFHLVSTLLPL